MSATNGVPALDAAIGLRTALSGAQLADFQEREELGLGDLLAWIWRARLVIGAFAVVCTALAIIYGQVATVWYTAEILLVPAEDKSLEGTNSLSGLANRVGLSVASSTEQRNQSNLAVLKSKDFAREFISRSSLDAQIIRRLQSSLIQRLFGRASPLDIRDEVKYFDTKIRAVDDDKRTGLITLTVSWTDPQVAADWANQIVQDVNDRLRLQSLAESEQNIEYLKEQVAGTQVTALQEAVGHMLESEMQKLMVARGNREFAFKVIDSAHPPKEKAAPKRTLLAVGGMLVGLFVGVVFALIRQSSTARPGR